MTDCHHAPSADPRKNGRCAKCGRVIPDPSEPLHRSLEFERGTTHQACKGVVDPSRLIEHAEARALRFSGEYVSDPMHVATGRRRRRDVREELADARNHLLWDTQEHLDNPERCAENLIGLRLITLAYERLVDRD